VDKLLEAMDDPDQKINPEDMQTFINLVFPCLDYHGSTSFPNVTCPTIV